VDKTSRHYNPLPKSSQPWSGKKVFFLSLLALGVFLGLLCLGFWQLGRAQGKESLAASVSAAAVGDGLDNSGFVAMVSNQDEHLLWRNVVLRGHFDDKHQLLWQNRFYKHRLGVEVLTPFYLAGSNRWVLVNRGWLDVDHHKNISVSDGARELHAVVVKPSRGLLLGENITGQWPVKDMQAWDESDFQQLYGENGVPYLLRLSAAEIDGFVRDWPLWTMSPERHRGYAWQWFLLALTWLIGCGCFWRSRRAL
jgi:surfeit locus 1 family protein